MNLQKTEKYVRKITQVLFLLVTLISTIFASSGDVDTTFNPGLISQRNDNSIYNVTVKKILIQPDGKIIAIGRFRAVDKYVRDGIARFNTDGTVDTTFIPPIFAESTVLIFDGNISAVALQLDGKILIGLNQDLNVGGNIRKGIARLNPDGSLDTTFNILNDPNSSFSGNVTEIKVSSDAKVIFAGNFTYNISGNNVRTNVVRVLSDGTPDLGFNTQSLFSNNYGILLQILVDGKIIISSSSGNVGTPLIGHLYRLNSDGSLDSSFTSTNFTNDNNSNINSIRIQTDNKILVGGSFLTVNGFGVPKNLVRFNSDGSFDTSFNTNGAGTNFDVKDLEILSDGRILIGGSFTSYNNVSKQNIAMVNSNGSLENGFNYSGIRLIVLDLAVQTDGKIVIGTNLDVGNYSLIRLNPDAVQEVSFKPALGNFGSSRKVFVQSDGKILVGGVFTFADRKLHSSIVRLNTDGSTDEQFISPNLSSTTLVLGIDVRLDGKIVLAKSNGISILNSDGTQSATSLTGGSCPDAKFLPDGNILAVGNFYLRKINTNTGQVDFSFDVPTNAFIYKIALQPDGKILVAGEFTTIKGVTRTRIARLNADGTIDNSFNSPGGANGTIHDMVLQSDGKILIGGQFTGVNFDTNRKYLARLNSDGSLDTSFTPTVNNVVSSLKIQSNGKILIGGLMNIVNGILRNSLARLNADGSVDLNFNLGERADGYIRSIDLQANNNIIIGGEFRYVNNLERIGVARLLNNSVQAGTPFDFDGDRRTDISIFRPNSGQWWYLRSSDNSNRALQFGSSSDKIVPADFTGDGKTDIAVFKPYSGEWFILRSEDASFYSFPFGANGDIPAAADFDGDGKADSTIFRPSNSTWYSLNSTGGTTIRQFGISGDLPVVGDYDGDSKADLAIFRLSNGQWWINLSATQNTVVYNFGNSTDKLVPADYTGDGKTDVAFFRPISGEWFILRSEDASFYSFPFGANGDIPATGDYDGDGKADAAVFRNSNTTWYLQQSTNGFSAVGFGLSGDKPVPSAYIP